MNVRWYYEKKNPDRYCDPGSGAGNQSRTDDLVITNDVLYQLSHASKIVGFSVDPTIISNFSPFVNPFLKIFFGGERRPWRGQEDLGGREPPLERRGSLPPNLPLSPRTSPTTPPFTKRRFFSLFVVAGSWGKFLLGREVIFSECGFAPDWRAGAFGYNALHECRDSACRRPFGVRRNAAGVCSEMTQWVWRVAGYTPFVAMLL